MTTSGPSLAPAVALGMMLVLLMMVVPLGPAGAQGGDGKGPIEVSIGLDIAHRSVLEADRFTFTSVITNTGNVSTGAIVAHLNVASLEQGIYVDPEDWSHQRTQRIENIGPGSSERLEWTIQALVEGEFAVYVVVFPKDLAEAPVVSQTISVEVGNRTVLKLGDALPVGITVPLVLVAMFVVLRRRHRRNDEPAVTMDD